MCSCDTWLNILCRTVVLVSNTGAWSPRSRHSGTEDRGKEMESQTSWNSGVWALGQSSLPRISRKCVSCKRSWYPLSQSETHTWPRTQESGRRCRPGCCHANHTCQHVKDRAHQLQEHLPPPSHSLLLHFRPPISQTKEVSPDPGNTQRGEFWET